MALRLQVVTLVSVLYREQSTRHRSGALMHGIMSSIAEFYSRNLAKRSDQGQAQKVKGGGPAHWCRVPPGLPERDLRRVEGREIRTVEIDPRPPRITCAGRSEAYATGNYTLATSAR